MQIDLLFQPIVGTFSNIISNRAHLQYVNVYQFSMKSKIANPAVALPSLPVTDLSQKHGMCPQKREHTAGEVWWQGGLMDGSGANRLERAVEDDWIKFFQEYTLQRQL